MKNRMTHFLELILLTLLLVVFVPGAALAVTIINSISVESSTGGQKAVSGIDGADGKNGKDGQPGADGVSVTTGAASISIKAKSVVDGVTVFDTSISTTTADYQSIDLRWSDFATSNQDDYPSDAAAGFINSSNNFSDKSNLNLKELLASIHLILLSYVNQLF